MDVIVRQAGRDDISLLSDLSSKSFYDTYAAYNTAADIKLYMNAHFNAAQIGKEIDEENSYFFIAFSGGRPAGYARLRIAEEPEALRETKHIEIERIYVLQEFQKQKIGLKLMDRLIETATIKGFDVIWLGVWQQNSKAIDFYSKRGFEIFGDHIFMFGTDAQKDHLMKLKLAKK